MAIEVGKENFENEVLHSVAPVLVDFWGARCHQCLALMPAIEDLEKKYEGKIKVTKLNAGEGNRMLCARLRVLSLPSFIFYRNGVEMKRLSGEQLTRKDIEEAIKDLIGWQFVNPSCHRVHKVWIVGKPECWG
jgi:thioredoxin 1